MTSTKPFLGYKKILTKEELRGTFQKKKGARTRDWKNILLRIWKIVDEQRKWIVTVLLLVVISSVLGLVGPLLLGKTIDFYIVEGRKEGIIWMLLALLFVYLFHSVTLYLQNYWMVQVAQQTIYRMRMTLFKRLLHLPIRFFDQRQHGEIMSRATNDIETISATLNSAFIQVFSSVLTFVGTLCVMLYLSPLLTLLTMLIIPMMFYAMRWITRRTGTLFKKQQVMLGELNGFIEETISGQSIVKAFSQEQQVIKQFHAKSEELRTIGFWAQSYSGYIPKVMSGLNNVSFAIVAGIGGLLAFHDHISIGTIVIFAEYTRQFTRPLNDLSNQFNTVLSAIAGAERVFAIMDEPEEKETGTLEPVLQGAVSFRNVVFRYGQDDDHNVLQRVAFDSKPGQTIALVGPTGAGKTTIMQLLARLYDANEGAVLFDGINVQQIKRQALRRQMAYVLQDSFLFEASIYDNIRYGKLHATNEEIIEATKKVNAHDFIVKLPNGYDTILTAGGSEISQGQRQLLSIARALIADPVILLLDEATSSIDTVTEMKIQEALNVLLQGRTSFVIAHRLNTVRNADLILVIQDGQIVESGSPQQLQRRGGVYASMLQANTEFE